MQDRQSAKLLFADNPSPNQLVTQSPNQSIFQPVCHWQINLKVGSWQKCSWQWFAVVTSVFRLRSSVFGLPSILKLAVGKGAVGNGLLS